jgi:HNH endonuclease
VISSDIQADNRLEPGLHIFFIPSLRLGFSALGFYARRGILFVPSKPRFTELEKKEKKRAFNLAYYAKHKVRLLSESREYHIRRRKNPDFVPRPKTKMSDDERRRKSRERQQKNKEKYAVAAAKWRKNHKSEQKEYRASYFQKYYPRVRSRILEYQLKYRTENKQKIQELLARYHAKNPSKRRAISQKYKALKKGAIVGDVALISNWDSSWRKSKMVRCYWCSNSFSPNECHADHIIALNLGGLHCIENLCISCQHCNASKQDKTIEEWNKKLNQPVLL